MSGTNLPSIIAGRYRVMRELGRGGMGAVYLVEHVHTGEQLALKVLLAQEALQPDAIERFKREARAPAKIRSEHVVRVTDADVAPELGGAPFMVMEALQGKDLEAVVKERGKLPPSEVAWILGQVANALDKAHAIGIVHRDLKPENIFLHTRDDGTPIIKILDFGISKIREKDGDPIAAAGLTQTGAVMGTPLYMSPEQARGHMSNLVGPQTDIWALGLVTLRLLTGEIYWHGIDTLADLLMKIMVDPLPPPSVRFPQLTVNIDTWFARSCERDLTRRFATVGEQVRAFTAVIGGTSMSTIGNNMLGGANAPLQQLGGTMVLGAASQNQTGPHVQTNVHGSPQTGPQLPPQLVTTPNPVAPNHHANHTGPGAPLGGSGPQHQAGPVALVQTGPSSQPFLQTTSGVSSMVRTSIGTDPPRASSSGKVALILVPAAIIALVGVVGAAVYVPRWRSSHTTSSTEPPIPTPSTSASASATVPSTTTTTPPPSATAIATGSGMVATTDPKSSATTRPIPSSHPLPTKQPTASATGAVKTVPTTPPTAPATASTKFNPVAP